MQHHTRQFVTRSTRSARGFVSGNSLRSCGARLARRGVFHGRCREGLSDGAQCDEGCVVGSHCPSLTETSGAFVPMS